MHATPSQRQHMVYWPGRVSAVLPLAVFILLALRVPHLQDSGPLAIQLSWVPSLNVQLSFFLDGLGLLFSLIISGIGFLITVYADGYIHGAPSPGKFYAYLQAFLFSMLGLVLSNHLLVMFVFWELTTLFSFLLIGFEHEAEPARSSARQAMLITGGGGMVMLAGILLIEQLTGTYTISELSGHAEFLRHHRLYLPILICILAGAFTKSAQFPFHFWLPNAMSAPTPISAFLHSATLVKAGIYLLARLHPVLGGTLVWMTILVLAGAVTAVWGAMVSLIQTDMKRILAHTTIMALGIITMFLGGRTTPALTAAITFLLVHALYKSSLFMVVGAIDHQVGTREIVQIGGIGKIMPFTAVAALMAALSMAGFPLFLGFIGKEIMYKGALTETVYPGLATTAALVANALMVAVAASLTLRPFWGRQLVIRPDREAPWQLWFSPMVLGMVSLGFGLIPDWVSRWLVKPAVVAFHPTSEEIHLKLFHGFNEPLLLSMLTITLGGIAYVCHRWLRRWIRRFANTMPVRMEAMYDGILKATLAAATWQTRMLQNGSLFRYLSIIIGSTLVVVGWALLRSVEWPPKSSLAAVPGYLALLLLSMVVSIGVVVRTRSRLTAVCALGVIGAGIAILFLVYGAPDVGLTQMLVETLTLIIAAIVLLRLPGLRHQPAPDNHRRVFRLVMALASGAVVAGLLMSVNQYALDRGVTDFYQQASYLMAHGRNIVNVILVDFRGLDTMGEITVVAASALATLALIRKMKDTL
jgi:multicomponent Na+:H+ antiporter subunit A